MPALYRLRIELDNRPGALAYVSSVLARRALDIVDVVVYELDDDRAVDEIVVRGPTHLNIVALAGDLAVLEAKLLSANRCPEPDDLVSQALRWAAGLADQPDPRGAVEDAIKRVSGAESACLLSADEANEHDSGRRALGRGAPIVLKTSDLPSGIGGPHVSPRWLLAAPDAGADIRFVAFAARPLSMRFSTTEIERVSAVLSVHRQLCAVRVG